MKKIDRRDFLKLAGSAGLTVVAGGLPRRSFGQEKEYLIGQVITMTGAGATWGKKQFEGLRFVIDEVNARGGIKSLGGAKLKHVLLDNETNVDVNKTQMEKMASQNPLVIFGNISSPCTMVGTLVSEKYKIPQMVVQSTKDEITERGLKYTFRYCPKSAITAEKNCAYIEWVSKETGVYPKKCAVMMVQGWERAAQAYEKWAKEKNIYYDTYYYPPTQDDFTVILSKYKYAGVDLICRVSYPRDATRIVQTMKTIDYNPIASLGTSGGDASPEFLEILGRDGDFVSVLENYPEDMNLLPWVKDVNARFKKRFGYDIEHSSGQVLCAASAVIDALERAGSTDHDKIRDALAKTDIKFRQYWLVMPDGVKFDGEGQNTEEEMPISQWYRGKKHIIFPTQYATMKPFWPMPKWSERAKYK